MHIKNKEGKKLTNLEIKKAKNENIWIYHMRYSKKLQKNFKKLVISTN